MTETEYRELACAYVALSNAHRVDLIRPLFGADARYVSSAVGEFQGTAAIIDMMQGFFNRFPDVHWQISQLEVQANRVRFEFVMTATGTEAAGRLRRQGVEIIEFDANGLIKYLEVVSVES